MFHICNKDMLHAIVSGINYCHFLRNRINPLMVINVTCHQYIHTFLDRKSVV